ncbi:MAG: class I SAM-dependent methyltransferase [Lachnospiraceae bacterium]|nr:class I SAM-dependent methyltransferase [Lachnospiraceae bacterium]
MNSLKTIDYYNKNLKRFVLDTEDADVSALRGKFVDKLPEKAYILDWGCGSGRDSKAFLEAGYDVDAVDASKKLADYAGKKTGIKVKCQSFEELKARDKYDGIWACASLLHLEKNKLREAFKVAHEALKKGGIIYASFKYGEFEGERKGRYYSDMTEEALAKLLAGIAFEREEMWISVDVRKDRGEEKWLNLILRK